jgi:hypothetical protein
MAVGMKNRNRKRKADDSTLLSDSFKEELNSHGNDKTNIKYIYKIMNYYK